MDIETVVTVPHVADDCETTTLVWSQISDTCQGALCCCVCIRAKNGMTEPA